VSAAQLELAAEILGPIVDEVVFVGGATIYLWITEPAAPPVRATDDVDVICEVASTGDYYRLGDRLRKRGLREAVDEPVICRWRHSGSGLAIDVMPALEEVLGFSNPWYGPAIETAQVRTLESGASIRAAVPPLMVATKLAAWRGRGKGDVLLSLDIHDILVLIDGRPELAEEMEAAAEDVRSFVAAELDRLRSESQFTYAAQSATSGYGPVAGARADVLVERIELLVGRLSA
jgi:hypothetical protein